MADVLRAALQPLWPLVELAFVYGSLAKGTEHAGSDVDLMVIGTLASNAQLLEALLPAQAQRVRDGKLHHRILRSTREIHFGALLACFWLVGAMMGHRLIR